MLLLCSALPLHNTSLSPILWLTFLCFIFTAISFFLNFGGYLFECMPEFWSIFLSFSICVYIIMYNFFLCLYNIVLPNAQQNIISYSVCIQKCNLHYRSTSCTCILDDRIICLTVKI